MNLTGKIERAFADRPKPSEVILPEQMLQFDSDVEEALWFAGRDGRELTWNDWQSHSCAIFFFSPDAFAYYLPSLLLLSAQNPDEGLTVAHSLIYKLDRSPDLSGWHESLIVPFLALNSDELEVLKEWLLLVCEFSPYKRFGVAASGLGDTFGRAYDSVDLLQRQVEHAHPADSSPIASADSMEGVEDCPRRSASSDVRDGTLNYQPKHPS